MFFEGLQVYGGFLSGRRRVRRLVLGFSGWSECLGGRDESESQSAAESHEWNPQDVQYEWPERLQTP